MTREQKKETMGKVYREFSRQKYNKYKHQFPKMRESQIVAKIIREWDGLDIEAKERLQRQYETNRSLIPQDISESESGKKTEFRRAEKSYCEKREEEPVCDESTPARKVIKEVCQLDDLGLLHEKPTTAKKQDSPSDEASSTAKRVKSLIKNKDYIHFFKHHYQKYTKEHPQWKSTQISTIIKLLWRKRKNQNKKLISSKSSGKIENKKKKILSGRNLFRKVKGLSAPDSSNKWKRLSMESRKIWQNEAKGEKPTAERETKLILRGTPQPNIFDFLGKLMS